MIICGSMVLSHVSTTWHTPLRRCVVASSKLPSKLFLMLPPQRDTKRCRYSSLEDLSIIRRVYRRLFRIKGPNGRHDYSSRHSHAPPLARCLEDARWRYSRSSNIRAAMSHDTSCSKIDNQETPHSVVRVGNRQPHCNAHTSLKILRGRKTMQTSKT